MLVLGLREIQHGAAALYAVWRDSLVGLTGRRPATERRAVRLAMIRDGPYIR
jgi:hypothetical protein